MKTQIVMLSGEKVSAEKVGENLYRTVYGVVATWTDSDGTIYEDAGK